MPNALILGSGMVGSAFARLAPEHGWQVRLLTHNDFELTDAQSVKTAVLAARPDVVFHAAALTKVNYCEEHPEEALAVNGAGTANVVDAAERAGARLVYISSDYVFDGRKGEPYDEEDKPRPINAYGQSKLGGEARVLGYQWGRVVRTSGVFGPRISGLERNFIRAIRDALSNGTQAIEVLDDQFTSITYAPHLAAICLELLKGSVPRLVHLTSAGEGSWYDWACQVEQAMYTGPSRIQPVSQKSRDTGTPRPMYSVLQSKYPEVRRLVAERKATAAIAEYIGQLD